MVRSKKQIEKYLNEAIDRVWLMRNNIGPETTRVPDDIKRKALAEKERIEREYDWSDYSWTDENNEMHLIIYDKDYCHWEGIIAALRWVLGEDEKDNYDT